MATSFGRDTSCTTSMLTGRRVSGARLVAESAYRRLTTPRGMLRGGEAERNFGLDLTAVIGRTDAKTIEAALPGLIEAELTKDERIESVDVVVFAKDESSAGGRSFEITIEAITSDGPFTLAILASEVTTELLGIQAEG